MITVASAAAALLFATGQTAPQTPPAPQPAPGADITSSLNSGPPRAATYLAPAPAPVVTAPPATTPAAGGVAAGAVAGGALTTGAGAGAR